MRIFCGSKNRNFVDWKLLPDEDIKHFKLCCDLGVLQSVRLYKLYFGEARGKTEKIRSGIFKKWKEERRRSNKCISEDKQTVFPISSDGCTSSRDSGFSYAPCSLDGFCYGRVPTAAPCTQGPSSGPQSPQEAAGGPLQNSASDLCRDCRSRGGRSFTTGGGKSKALLLAVTGEPEEEHAIPATHRNHTERQNQHTNTS